MEVLSFFTINAGGGIRPWRMTLDDLRNEYYGNCDLPSLDDPVELFELDGIPMYFDTFYDVIKTFGIDK